MVEPAPLPSAATEWSQRLGSEFDPAALARLQALDPQGEAHLIRRLLRLYADVARVQSEAMRVCVERGDVEGLRHAVHTIRSSSLSMGAEGFALACQTLERRIQSHLGAQDERVEILEQGTALAVRARSIGLIVASALSETGPTPMGEGR